MKRLALLLTALAAAAGLSARPVAAAGFRSGFAANAERAFDVGLRAYAYGLPLLNEQRVIENFPPDRLINVTSLSTPAQRLVVLPNVDTLYTVARLRLAAGPFVVHVPEEHGRYYTLQFLDAYTNSFAYIGRRTTGTKPGDYVIAGPRWHGRAPGGLRVLRSATPVVWLLGRTFVRGPGDVPAVNLIQHEYGLRRLGGAPIPSLSIPSSTLRPAPLPTGLGFFDALGATLRENPPPARDRGLLATFGRFGIGPGRRTSRARLPRGARAGLAAAVGAGPALISAYGAHELRISARHHRNWLVPRPGIGNFGRDFLLRAYISVNALGANVRPEAIYPTTRVDGAGRALTGANRYRVHFAAGELPPVRAFWSLTLYGPARFLVPNAIDRYALGSQSGLSRNADGSLDIYVQHDPPAGHAANWLPAPSGRFSLALRLYLPEPSVLDGTWPLPRVRRR